MLKTKLSRDCMSSQIIKALLHGVKSDWKMRGRENNFLTKKSQTDSLTVPTVAAQQQLEILEIFPIMYDIRVRQMCVRLRLLTQPHVIAIDVGVMLKVHVYISTHPLWLLFLSSLPCVRRELPTFTAGATQKSPKSVRA